MEDRFFAALKCDRCKDELNTRIMSKMNEDVICLRCKKEEQTHPLYAQASARELEEVERGNMEYRGLFAGQVYPFR